MSARLASTRSVSVYSTVYRDRELRLVAERYMICVSVQLATAVFNTTARYGELLVGVDREFVKKPGIKMDGMGWGWDGTGCEK